MTRNEAIKEFREIDQEIKRNTFLISFDELIHKIYNDFEKELEELNNRSCESCKYSFDIFTDVNDSLLGEDFICTKLEVDKVFEKDFYCSEFEAKRE